MVLAFHGRKIPEKIIAERMEACPDAGVSPKALATFFRQERHRFSQASGLTLRRIDGFLDKGWPVIVAYQDWAHKPSQTNYAVTWDNGHYAIVAGHEEGRIWLVDPSSKRKRRSLDATEFIARWRDITVKGETIHRWGVAIGPRRGD